MKVEKNYNGNIIFRIIDKNNVNYNNIDNYEHGYIKEYNNKTQQVDTVSQSYKDLEYNEQLEVYNIDENYGIEILGYPYLDNLSDKEKKYNNIPKNLIYRQYETVLDYEYGIISTIKFGRFNWDKFFSITNPIIIENKLNLHPDKWLYLLRR